MSGCGGKLVGCGRGLCKPRGRVRTARPSLAARPHLAAGVSRGARSLRPATNDQLRTGADQGNPTV
ncbi:hypothetical protein DPMN_057163 [Dreissena polymorpha]|uniref:Uncharacterized protein n=1 Tax=Dreissena polymorpha TaxID=45954 RepID=A0A9D4HS51_DREPO|nr:hypothetical protein DPMN_057163 [Dreissena polymorpha]